MRPSKKGKPLKVSISSSDRLDSVESCRDYVRRLVEKTDGAYFVETPLGAMAVFPGPKGA